MRRGLVFVDPLTPDAYGAGVAGLHGAETALTRLSEALVRERDVTVRRSARAEAPQVALGVRYVRFDPDARLTVASPDIVVLNSWKVALRQRRLHPDSRVTLWLHVFPGRHNRAMGPALQAAGVEVVCVSAAQARWLRAFLGEAAPAISHIPNPIDDALAPDATPRDPNLLLFAGDPRIGLDQVVRRFAALRVRWPDLRLAVADPVGQGWPAVPGVAGLRRLGRLDHAGLIGWMRRALCLFHPQDRGAETFDLAVAEANAVGCPALLQRGLGANDEVASTADQCIDAADPDAIARFIDARRSLAPAPAVAARPEFRLSAVAGRWSERFRFESPRRPSKACVPAARQAFVTAAHSG